MVGRIRVYGTRERGAARLPIVAGRALTCEDARRDRDVGGLDGDTRSVGESLDHGEEGVGREGGRADELERVGGEMQIGIQGVERDAARDGRRVAERPA